MNNEDSSKNLSITDQVFDPTSDLYLDNLLDVVSSISYDIHCSGTWKNTKPIKAFLDRFSNFPDQILKSRVSLNDFNIIKTVGQGGFGRVDLVKHKQSKQIYAMKVMDKSTFVQNSFNGFWEERDIMVKNASDWLIKCFYTFMDLKKLYIVMEYMPGGDLYHWMSILEDFSDEQTHFYAMEMVLAVEILHNMGFLHRDLKPDNMLLDKCGHLKLADFGTCIKVKNGKVKTNFQVGTPDYISPEILRNTGIHDLEVGFEIDWWAFGIVIYELFYGETPFEGESTSTLYQNIMCYKKTLNYPDDKPAKPEFYDFLSKILTEPNERMGIKEIKQHAYLTNSEYKWTFNTIREHQSPVIFEVSGDDDTNNITFDPNDKRNNISNSFTNNNYFSGENLAFSGFTFNRNEKYTVQTKNHNNNNPNLTELETKLSESELSKQQLTVKLENTSNELLKVQTIVTKISAELIEKDQILNTKKTENTAIQDTNKQLKNKIDSLTKQNEATQREIEQLKAGIAEKEGLIKSMKTDNDNISEEISNLQTSLQLKADKINKLTCELDEKQGQIDNLKKLDYLLEEEKTRNQNLLNDVNAKNRKIKEYESQLEIVNNNVIQIQSQNIKTNTVQTNVEELERLRLEKQKLEIRLNHLTNDLNHMEELKNVVQSELSGEKQKKLELEKTRDNLSKEITNQKNMYANLKNKLNSAEDQKKVLKQKINVIESEKDQIEQQKKMFESMVEVRKAENEELAAQLEESEEISDRREKEFEAEKENYELKLNNLRADYDNLKMENAKLLKKMQELELNSLELGYLNQRIEKFKQDLEDKKKEINTLTKLVATRNSEIEKNERQIANDKSKITSLVTKIDEMIKDPKKIPQVASRKKKDSSNAESSRIIKQLESDLNKEKMKFSEKVKECNETKNEFQRLVDQMKELRTELENKNNTIKELTSGTNNNMLKPLMMSGDLMKSSELQSLEGKIEILKKGKGRHRITWLPSFAILKPYKLDIFQSENDNNPIITIDLRSVLHIHQPSSAECVHIEKPLLPRILQIIYEKHDMVEDNRRQSVIAMDTSKRMKSSTYSHDELNSSLRSSMVTDTSPQTGIYNLENHSFVSMRFRSYTNCDICHQSCSDLLNPPSALECSKCKSRIHFDHISSNEKIQWCQGAIELILFKVDTVESKMAWLDTLNKLKIHQKENEVKVSPNTFYRSMRQPILNSPGNTSIPES